MNLISWEDFQQIELRVGTIVEATSFPEARQPAYKLHIDFGKELGILKSSAQITANYSPSSLEGTQIIAVVNFPKKQIGPFMSEVLVTGFPDDKNNIVLARPEFEVPNGTRLM